MNRKVSKTYISLVTSTLLLLIVSLLPGGFVTQVKAESSPPGYQQVAQTAQKQWGIDAFEFLIITNQSQDVYPDHIDQCYKLKKTSQYDLVQLLGWAWNQSSQTWVMNTSYNFVDNEDHGWFVMQQGWLYQEIAYNKTSTPMQDTTPPMVNSFSVSPSSVTLGGSFTISFSVSDSGGSGLKQVELLRCDSSWATINTLYISGNSYSDSFTDIPSSVGTYLYGIHVFDNAGNSASENGPIMVTMIETTTQDNTNPVVNSLSVSPSSVTLGGSFTISFSVSDSGGSGLKQVELLRCDSSWATINTLNISGNSYAGSFTDIPSSVGTYWYGIHVFDYAGNSASENGPISVTVTSTPAPADTLIPILLVHGFELLHIDPFDRWLDMAAYLTGMWDFINVGEMERFEGNGVVVYISHYTHQDSWGTDESILTYAANLGDEIDIIKNWEKNQGRSVQKVDIIAHSMGGLVARTYIESIDFYGTGYHYTGSDYDNDVRNLIMLGTPNQGAYFAELFEDVTNWQSINDMVVGGSFIDILNEGVNGHNYSVRYYNIIGNHYHCGGNHVFDPLWYQAAILMGYTNCDDNDSVVNVRNAHLDGEDGFYTRDLKHSQLRTATNVTGPIINRILSGLLFALGGVPSSSSDVYSVTLYCNAQIRVFDTQGRVTGVVNGQILEQIPNSVYDNESQAVIISPANDFYICEVIGVDQETYSLEVTDNELGSFVAIDIPIGNKAAHRYTIDWNALSQGQEGVTIKIDSDGNGSFERTISAGNELTATEFSIAETEPTNTITQTQTFTTTSNSISTQTQTINTTPNSTSASNNSSTDNTTIIPIIVVVLGIGIFLAIILVRAIIKVRPKYTTTTPTIDDIQPPHPYYIPPLVPLTSPTPPPIQKTIKPNAKSPSPVRKARRRKFKSTSPVQTTRKSKIKSQSLVLKTRGRKSKSQPTVRKTRKNKSR